MNSKNIGRASDKRQQPEPLATFLGSSSNGKRSVTFVDPIMANIYYQVLLCKPESYHCWCES